MRGEPAWRSLYTRRPAGDDAPRSALAMFRQAASASPGAPFVHYFTTTLSYGEVDRLSDALAAALAARGLARGDRVALYLQNVPQFAIAVIATWKAGGIPAPLNPMLKHREVATHVAVARPTVLICLESLHEHVSAAALDGVDVITTSELDLLEGGRPEVLQGSRRQRPAGLADLLELCRAHDGESLPDPALGPDDVAFLTFTSGTTGPPKGAMNTHGNVVFNARVYRDWVGVDGDDVLLCIAPLFHITGLVAFLAVAMLTATPLVLAFRFDPATTLALVEHHRATYAVAAITAFVALLDEPTRTARDLTSLQKLYSGGAPVPPAILGQLESALGAYVHNIYGLTETTGPSHAVPLGRRAPVDPTTGALSVGVPVFETGVRVLADDGTELPPGEVGELAIRGPQVVPGYWEQAGETASAMPGGELRTGDVGFRDADGWFFVVDRRKDQINAAGYKIWPREVEDVVYEHPAVREAAVVGVPDDYRGETVKAYVSLRAGATLEPEDLIDFCRQRMAAYKYPRRIEILDELPKTASGKVLRRELRQRAVDGRVD